MKQKSLFLVFCGLPGSGKTTVARRLASSLGIAYIDYDTIVQPFLIGIEKAYGLGESRLAFYRKWRRESYGALIAVMKENIRLGLSLIVSAPFSSEMQDEKFFSRLRKDACSESLIFSFHMVPEVSTHLDMLKRRSSYRDDEILSSWDEYVEKTHGLKPRWDADESFEIVFSNTDDAYSKIISEIKNSEIQEVMYGASDA